METEREPIHLLVRFSDKMGAMTDTMEAHREVILKHRAVWFGKMGKTLAHERVRRMNAQWKQKIPTYLYLVQSGKRNAQVYRGTVLEISRELPLDEKKLIPRYYRDTGLLKFMKLWIKISDIQRMPEGWLNNLYVAGSGSRVSDILHTSMAGLFVIKERSIGGRSIIYRSRASLPSG
jgi:hypothetical protein